MVVANESERAFSRLFRIGNLKGSHALSDRSKWEQIFPLKIAMAIDAGDEEKGRSAVEEVLDLLNSRADFPVFFVTENLYIAAYYLFTIGDYSKSLRLNLRLLSRYRPKDFHGPLWPMVKIMASFLAFELDDHSEVVRLDKNFRMSNAYGKAPYFKTVLGTLLHLSKPGKQGQFAEILEDSSNKFRIALNDRHSKMLNRRFNFEIWLESKRKGCLMADIFAAKNERTISNRSQDVG